jgi:SurA N-terminal domain
VIRRTIVVVGALVALVLLPSCSTLNSNNHAAEVGDTSLERDDFETYLRDVLTANEPGTQADEIAADQARQILSGWVVDQMIIQFLDSQGVEVTEADRASVVAAFDAQLAERGVTISDSTHRLVIEGSAARAVLNNMAEAATIELFADEIEVTVDSRYGYWDADSGTLGAVVAFG